MGEFNRAKTRFPYTKQNMTRSRLERTISTAGISTNESFDYDRNREVQNEIVEWSERKESDTSLSLDQRRFPLAFSPNKDKDTLFKCLKNYPPLDQERKEAMNLYQPVFENAEEASQFIDSYNQFEADLRSKIIDKDYRDLRID